MTVEKLFHELQRVNSAPEVQNLIRTFENIHQGEFDWISVGNRENNQGTIEMATDPGRSLIERLTNGIDAILEAEYERHKGIPACRNPREAAAAWLGVPSGGLSDMTSVQRRELAQRVVIRILPGDGSREARIGEVRDFGIGITPEQMPKTILSLNESNKWRKHYLAGTYGQGGSSTFASSKYTFIASRYDGHPFVGFTIVRYQDLPPEEYKTGHYVYLVLNGVVPQIELAPKDFPIGTQVKHFGYDLSSYPSPLGPNSIYGLLNQVLFDPILPVWLDDRVHEYRRVIKGSRNALNGAVDEGDEERRGPRLSHSVRMFYVSLGEFGQIGVEYWVLEKPSRDNKRPTAAFVNPSKSIILTVNGQNHDEMSSVLVRKNAELPYLAQRLICHIDCNHLTPDAKRALFASTREGARRGAIYKLIQQEVIRVLKSDDELIRLNNEARQQGMHEMDESAIQQMRREVARIIRLQGLEIAQIVGGEVAMQATETERPTHPRSPRPQPQPIELHEPPTYIRILWEEDTEISFYQEQRRYIRIETDAHSRYHYPNNPSTSRINIIINGGNVVCRGSTPLQGGRMRIILECASDAEIGSEGKIRVELARSGLPTLSNERSFRIVETPFVHPSDRRVTIPPFEVRPVDGPEDGRWLELGWPENINVIASSAEMENGKLVIYYSTVFPKFTTQRAKFEARDPAMANSFVERYKIWLAVHSLLLEHDHQASVQQQLEERPEIDDDREREERCRIAALASLFAAREVSQLAGVIEEVE